MAILDPLAGQPGALSTGGYDPISPAPLPPISGGPDIPDGQAPSVPHGILGRLQGGLNTATDFANRVGTGIKQETAGPSGKKALRAFGAAMLGAPNFWQGLSQGTTAFDATKDREAELDKPKNQFLADGAFTASTDRYGNVTTTPNDQVMSHQQGIADAKAQNAMDLVNARGSNAMDVAGLRADTQTQIAAANRDTRMLMAQMHRDTVAGQLPPIDGPAMNYLVDKYNTDHVMPQFGMGAAAAALRRQFLTAAATADIANGRTGSEAAVGASSYKADSSALTNLQKTSSAVLAFERNANTSIDRAKELAPKGTAKSGVPLFNRWIQAGRSAGSGDPDLAAFNVVINEAVAESAKIASGASGGAVTSDSARREMQALLNNAQTPEQLNAALEELRNGNTRRRAGIEAQGEEIRGRLRYGAQGQPQGQPIPLTTSTQTGRQGNNYNVPLSKVKLLLANPDKAADFDAKYGRGASAAFLKQSGR